jgi:hypothetical protein
MYVCIYVCMYSVEPSYCAKWHKQQDEIRIRLFFKKRRLVFCALHPVSLG